MKLTLKKIICKLIHHNWYRTGHCWTCDRCGNWKLSIIEQMKRDELAKVNKDREFDDDTVPVLLEPGVFDLTPHQMKLLTRMGVDVGDVTKPPHFARGGFIPSKTEIIEGSVPANSGPRPQVVHQDEVELMSEEVYFAIDPAGEKDNVIIWSNVADEINEISDEEWQKRREHGLEILARVRAENQARLEKRIIEIAAEEASKD